MARSLQNSQQNGKPWPTVRLKTPTGVVDAIAPLIVSASRATDIPAFHADWFFHRLSEGYCVWQNPFSGQKSTISFEHTKALVFWSKNPAPMLERIDLLNRFCSCYYFQFTLNDYEAEGLEPNVPPLEKRIATFRQLARTVGPERMVWRFDPIILSDRLTCNEILRRFKRIGDALSGSTPKLVFSFAYIDRYPKVRNNLRQLASSCRELTEAEMTMLADEMAQAARRWGMAISTCCTALDLTRLGIAPSRCVDPDLLLRLCGHDAKNDSLRQFLTGSNAPKTLFDLPDGTLNYKALKDKGQRKPCGCVWSKDIGQYSTCPHYCVYCYANQSRKIVARNAALFSTRSESILAEN